MTENMPEPLKSAMKGVQNMFTGPQRTMEELSSGVEDGLSRCTFSDAQTHTDTVLLRCPDFYKAWHARLHACTLAICMAYQLHVYSITGKMIQAESATRPSLVVRGSCSPQY